MGQLQPLCYVLPATTVHQALLVLLWFVHQGTIVRAVHRFLLLVSLVPTRITRALSCARFVQRVSIAIVHMVQIRLDLVHKASIVLTEQVRTGNDVTSVHTAAERALSVRLSVQFVQEGRIVVSPACLIRTASVHQAITVPLARSTAMALLTYHQ